MCGIDPNRQRTKMPQQMVKTNAKAAASAAAAKAGAIVPVFCPKNHALPPPPLKGIEQDRSRSKTRGDKEPRADGRSRTPKDEKEDKDI